MSVNVNKRIWIDNTGHDVWADKWKVFFHDISTFRLYRNVEYTILMSRGWCNFVFFSMSTLFPGGQKKRRDVPNMLSVLLERKLFLQQPAQQFKCFHVPGVSPAAGGPPRSGRRGKDGLSSVKEEINQSGWAADDITRERRTWRRVWPDVGLADKSEAV